MAQPEPSPAPTSPLTHPALPVVDPQDYWDLVWQQFRKNRLAMISAIVIVLMLLLAAWAPLIANGKPFVWRELKTDASGATHLVSSYPLFHYLVAPTRGISVDYIFNSLLFFSIVWPIAAAIVWFNSRRLTRLARRRRMMLSVLVAAILSITPFLYFQTHSRSATESERAANPSQSTVSYLAFFRPWKLDKRDYATDRRLLDAAKGEGSAFPPVPHDPTSPTTKILHAPDAEHLLGTDAQGRDVLSRLLHGARISLSVGFVAEGIAVLLGIIIGGLAGYYRGVVDIGISRIIEIVICFPSFFLIITIVAFIEERSIFHVMLIIGFTSWTGIARLVRGEFLKLADQDFVVSARALGCRGTRIMFTHILPNAMGPVLVAAAFGVAGAILVESSLSYLGFGAPPPTPTWGEMISQGKANIEEAWWLLFYPGVIIFLTVTIYNVAGSGLRDAMDPKLRQ